VLLGAPRGVPRRGGAVRHVGGFHSLDEATTEAGLERLRADMASGEWERRFGHLRKREEMDLGYRLLAASGGQGRSS